MQTIYRFTVTEAQEVPWLRLVELELNGLPRRGYWPVNWEWRYTFTQAGRELRKDLRYYLSKLALGLLKRLGVTQTQPAKNTIQYRQVTISSDSLRDALWKKLTEAQSRDLLQPNRMILVGPDVITALYNLPREDVFHIHLRGGMNIPARRNIHGQEYELEFYFYKIPVLYLPDFQGIAVIPDLTGTAERTREDNEYRPLPRF